MNIALAQLNYHIGNFPLNLQKIKTSIQRAKSENADLIIFSELSVCGYPPQDLLEKKEFIEKCQHALHEIKALSKDIAIIIGAPEVNPSPKGKNLYNSAYVLENNKIKHIQRKTLLPTYDIFDEYRYFEPNNEFGIVEIKNKKIALTVCEDLWYDQPVDMAFGKGKLYSRNPMKELAAHNPELIINIAASPFAHNREETKKEIFMNNAQKYQLPLIFLNQVGANTELIFEGGSLLLNKGGEVVRQLKKFSEDYVVFELHELDEPISSDSPKPDEIADIYEALILGLRDYFTKMNFKHVVTGLSGGIDSAVSTAIAAKALGKENVRVLLMPSQYSSAHSVSDAEQLAINLGIQYDIIPIKSIYKEFESALSPLFRDLEEDITEENIQSRIRAILLMAISNKFGNILLNTSNKSEAAVGYGTLYGDMAGGLSILGDVYKTKVYQLARYLNKDSEIIPENTIIKPPSAELRPGQKDSDSLPDYDMLDAILYRYIELQLPKDEIIAQGFHENVVNKIINLVNKNDYKRYQTPPMLRVTSKGFGTGRRIPIVAIKD